MAKKGPKPPSKGKKEANPLNSSKDSGKASSSRDPTQQIASSSSTDIALPPPPKPTARQIIGGTSWTGKLPQNLFNELCQKQKWEKPVYDMRKTPEGFSCWVTLSAKNPKTQEVTKLEPFKIPASHKHLITRDTPLEARHAAATYALFRVCSQQNRHSVLPPDYKALWKEFESLKKQDVLDGKDWMYEVDPFKALKDRQDAKAAAEKKRVEAEKAREKARKNQENIGLVMLNKPMSSNNNSNSNNSTNNTSDDVNKNTNNPNANTPPRFPSNPMKGWSNVPKIEMGRQTRMKLEYLVRKHAVWNDPDADSPTLTQAEKNVVLDHLSSIGFRRSHVEESLRYCRDQDEVLEWLLIYVPEDDLPSWALPERYMAGISLGAMDMKKEAVIQRLSATGYATDLVRSVLDAAKGDEALAAEQLQDLLLSSDHSTHSDTTTDGDEWERNMQWEEEVESLESVLEPDQFQRFRRQDDDEESSMVQVKLRDVRNAGKPVEVFVALRRPRKHYPSRLVVGVLATALPSYIKLSVVRQTLLYIQESLDGEPMKMYFVIDWIQNHINDIIQNPGRLLDVSTVTSSAGQDTKLPSTAEENRRKRQSDKRRPKPSDQEQPKSSDRQFAIEAWRQRQKAPEFRRMVEKRQTLPAWKVRDQIVKTVSDHHVTIISGETGSGKSTQSVQFVLDQLYDQGQAQNVNMLVTQPRRISALGLADRVAEERCVRVGDEVGYAIRGETKRSAANTRLTFMTTGVLLRRLQTAREDDLAAALEDVTHIVVDEVHERSLDTDFLLTILRNVLGQRPTALKLILMSATLDATAFASYFAQEGLSVGLCEIEGRTYPVRDLYLDDILHITRFSSLATTKMLLEDGDDNDYDGEEEDDDDDGYGAGYKTIGDQKNTKSKNASTNTIGKQIQNLGHRIPFDLLVATVIAIDQELSYTGKPGGILIFLPGVAEINRACTELRAASPKLHILPLHAALDTKDQKRVFHAPPSGKRKVVVATNVAETSITIDDIVAVIDSGRVKETSFDPQTNLRKLQETWVSRAAAKQRRGRAGRVQEGSCYKLYTRRLERDTMVERPDPEIRRVPLEQLCLSVRAMGVRDVAHFLSQAPTPPDSLAIDGALHILRQIGALDNDDALTALGQQLAMLPVDLRCGKLLVYGSIFGYLDECVTLAALLSVKSPFVSVPPEKRAAAKAARFCLVRPVTGTTSLPSPQSISPASNGFYSEGDLLTDMFAFQAWQKQPRSKQRSFCNEYFLSHNTLSDIATTRTQLLDALIECGIVSASDLSSSSSASSPSQTKSPSLPLLRALTVAAFSPQLARMQFPSKKYTATQSGAIEQDPEARAIKYFAAPPHARVFLHPSSILFDAQQFPASTQYVTYFDLMSTSGGNQNEKAFMRNVTPVSAFALLLFAGGGRRRRRHRDQAAPPDEDTLDQDPPAIALDTLGRGLVVSGWIRLRGWARIGVLVSRLRAMLDQLIALRIDQPQADVSSSEIILEAIRLVERNGLDA